MKEPSSTKSFWENHDYAFWEEAEARAGGDPIDWSRLRFLTRLAPALHGRSVLEMGCGSGVLTPYLASASHDVVGVDFSPNAIAAARRRCANLPNVSFMTGDVLQLDFDRRFDVITGSMFLHEIMHDDTAVFLDRLDGLMTDRGFLCFHENSYFNVFSRFIRERLVGRYGIPKHGSEHELPFDEARYVQYQKHFRNCDRFVDGVDLARKVHEYLSPIRTRATSRTVLAMDKLLTAVHSRTGWLTNWSYTQTIYASRSVPRTEALGP